MDLREHAKYISYYIPSGRVFCNDCGGQIILGPECGSMVCPTCDKSGYAEPELDTDRSLFAIPEKDGPRFYATIIPQNVL